MYGRWLAWFGRGEIHSAAAEIIIWTIAATAEVRTMTAIAMTMRGSTSISPRFDGPIDHAIPPRREDRQQSSKTDHAFPGTSEMPVWGMRVAVQRQKTSRASTG
jgi:hypothetical protein